MLAAICAVSASKLVASDIGTSADGKSGIEPKFILPLLPPRSIGMSKKDEGMTPSPVIVGIPEFRVSPSLGACGNDIVPRAMSLRQEARSTKAALSLLWVRASVMMARWTLWVRLG